MKFIQYTLTCLVPFLLIASAEAKPVVLKVEPPNWWTEYSWNPVRLLVHGRNFEGARVRTDRKDVEVGLVRVNAQGTYLFVDLHIKENANAGPIQLKVLTSSGEELIPFELNRPLDRTGRFQGFSSDDVIYLLMPDRFANGDPKNDDPLISKGLYDRVESRFYHGGDFQGIIKKLPYLKELGITAIWLNPIYDNNNQLNERETYDNRAITDYHGYGAVDFYGVEEHFGDLDLYKELVDAAHKQGIKVIMDQVANHTGPYHPWVNDSPTPTWYNGSEQEHLANVWQTWTLNDPYATDQTQKETLDGWFIDILPDLNQNDEETAFYLIQNSLWWIGVSGIDAIRQDTLPYVPRRYWREWADAVKREYPDFVLLGEMFDGDPAKVAFFQGGRPRYDGVDSGIDSLFDFPLYYKVRDAFAKKQSVHELAVTLSKDWLYENSDLLVIFLGLHDVSRFMNEDGATTQGLKLAFTFLLTTRGVPLIYYGDEIAMPGGGDPDNRRDFPGGWKEDERNAFKSSGRLPDEDDVFQYLKTLTHLRKQQNPLRKGKLVNLLANDQVYAYARTDDKDCVIIVINNSDDTQSVKFSVAGIARDRHSLFRDQLKIHSDVESSRGEISLTMSPRSASIFLEQ